MNEKYKMVTGRKQDLLLRTKAFALRIVRLYSALPKTTEAQVIGKQVLRSGTSVGAHVREGKRSRTDAELISKPEGALQELEETVYWLELLSEAGIVRTELLTDLMKEAHELTAIFVAGVKTVKQRRAK
ncbi:four helix bundle protein [Candidatus Poribacteria bacterium]|nr:four helix bundle protein [Candidatus Poribacteria bacterium]